MDGEKYKICRIIDSDGNEMDNHDYYIAIVNYHIIFGRVSQLTAEDFNDFGVAQAYADGINASEGNINSFTERFPGGVTDEVISMVQDLLEE